jgi:hypothetical protein
MTRKKTTTKGNRNKKLNSLKKADGKSSPKKETKLESLEQAHGKDERHEEAIAKAKELEDLLGIKEINPFGTSIASEFENSLSDLPMVDLQALAVKTGVFPNGTRRGLKAKLIRAFQEYNKSSTIIPAPQPIGIKNENSEAYKKARKLMQEGL